MSCAAAFQNKISIILSLDENIEIEGNLWRALKSSKLREISGQCVYVAQAGSLALELEL